MLKDIICLLISKQILDNLGVHSELCFKGDVLL